MALLAGHPDAYADCEFLYSFFTGSACRPLSLEDSAKIDSVRLLSRKQLSNAVLVERAYRVFHHKCYLVTIVALIFFIICQNSCCLFGSYQNMDMLMS